MRVCWMRKGIIVGVKHPRPCSLGSGCYGPKQPAATRLAGSDPPGEATQWTATIRQHHFGFAKTLASRVVFVLLVLMARRIGSGMRLLTVRRVTIYRYSEPIGLG